MTHTQILLTLLLSALGGTIIVSQGHIFKSFRSWLFAKSKKITGVVHDVSIPLNSNVSIIIVDGKDMQVVWGDNGIKEIIKLLSNDIVEYEEVRENAHVRYYITMRTKHKVVFVLDGNNHVELNTYEKKKDIMWITIIYDMISCPQCFGVWFGFLWYILYTLGAWNVFFFRMFCFGLIVSATTYMYFKVYNYLEKNSTK